MGVPYKWIRSSSSPMGTAMGDLALATITTPQIRAPPPHAPKASERHSPPMWAPATAFAEPPEFSQMPTLTANPVHRSPMASVRRLFGRPDEENIVMTLPQPGPTNSVARANPKPTPQSVQNQPTTTTEPPKTRDVIRSALFPRESTRKPSRRLIFKYLG